MWFWKCEFCQNYYFESVNFVKDELWKCEFREKWDFKNTNFVKSVILKIWILKKKLRFWKWVTSCMSCMWVISIVLSLTKSQWAGFSTSITPQGYSLPRIFLPLTSTMALAPTTAKGMESLKSWTCCLKSSSSSLKKNIWRAHWGKNQLFIQILSRIWCLKNVNFAKKRCYKCEFCEKWVWNCGFFFKNEILKIWILWKMRLWWCEFCEKWGFQNVNFWINWGFLPQCALMVMLLVKTDTVWYQFWGGRHVFFFFIPEELFNDSAKGDSSSKLSSLITQLAEQSRYNCNCNGATLFFAHLLTINNRFCCCCCYSLDWFSLWCKVRSRAAIMARLQGNLWLLNIFLGNRNH